MYNRIKLLLKTADESIIYEYRVNNSRKGNFDDFWLVIWRLLFQCEIYMNSVRKKL